MFSFPHPSLFSFPHPSLLIPTLLSSHSRAGGNLGYGTLLDPRFSRGGHKRDGEDKEEDGDDKEDFKKASNGIIKLYQLAMLCSIHLFILYSKLCLIQPN
jgi:hypothetical protein